MGRPRSTASPNDTFTARRLLLQSSAGAAAALFSGWSHLAAAQPRAAGKAKSVILIFNCGAPSHIDLWDPKPDATDNDSRRVQADLDERARHSNHRAAAANGPANRQAGDRPLGPSHAGQPQRRHVLFDGRPPVPHRQHAHQPQPHRLSLRRHARRLARPARRLHRLPSRRTSSRPSRTATARSISLPANTAAASAPSTIPSSSRPIPTPPISKSATCG